FKQQLIQLCPHFIFRRISKENLVVYDPHFPALTYSPYTNLNTVALDVSSRQQQHAPFGDQPIIKTWRAVALNFSTALQLIRLHALNFTLPGATECGVPECTQLLILTSGCFFVCLQKLLNDLGP